MQAKVDGIQGTEDHRVPHKPPQVFDREGHPARVIDDRVDDLLLDVSPHRCYHIRRDT
jgi:hypothetical protein